MQRRQTKSHVHTRSRTSSNVPIRPKGRTLKTVYIPSPTRSFNSQSSQILPTSSAFSRQMTTSATSIPSRSRLIGSSMATHRNLVQSSPNRSFAIKLTSHQAQAQPRGMTYSDSEDSDFSDSSVEVDEPKPVLNVKYDDFPMTKSAFKRLQALQKPGEELIGLRTLVDTGGCSGFQYIYEKETVLPEIRSQIVSPPSDANFNDPDRSPITQLLRHEDDHFFIRDGMVSIIDDVSIPFVVGAQLDYRVEMIRSAFAVMNNPNVDLACGCGTSFSKKEKKPDTVDV